MNLKPIALLILLAATHPLHAEEAAPLSPEIIRTLANIRPSPVQYNWMKMEFTAFAHFGINTFTDREWGSGHEDPNLFQPNELNTDQWCKFLADNGFKMIIFTAKHHDGFCLWPSRYTNHSVKSSTWRNGKGDVIKDLAASCKKYGIKLGLYLSPADLFQMVDSTEFGAGLYGNLSKPRKRTIPESVLGMKPFANKETFDVEVDDYNAYFMNQLFELLTEYGEVAEVWFDGAHPKHKGGQQYRKDLWEKLIRKLQPGIIIHGNGFDEMRWVGNEFGFAREAEWNVIPAKWAQTTPWKAADLGSRQLIAKIGETEFLWLPSETDVSIRPGWFYHASQDSQVKQPDHLLKIYLESIGRNSTLLLNIPPDRRGLIHENDVKAIETFHQRLSTALRTDFAAGATKQNNGLNLTLKKPAKFNLIVLQEDVLHTGQRIEKLHVEAQINGKWKEIARAETVGYKRVLKLFEPVTAQKVRVIIDQSRLTPTLSHLSLHYYPENDLYPPVYSAKKGIITLTPPKTVAFRSKRHVLHQPVNTTGYLIRYTTDDTAVTPTSPKYTQPLALQSGTLRVRCYRKNDDGSLGESTEIRIKISYPTEFITEESRAKKVDEALILKLKTPQLLQGFSFHPGTNRKTRCLISNYSLFISTDGKTWNPIRERDTFGNIKNSPTERNRRFSPQKAQWVKFIWHKSENQKFDLPAKQIKLFVK